MSGPVSGRAARGEALRADLRPAGRAPRPLAHPDLGPSRVEQPGCIETGR
jgi:hypothetical protein